MSQTVGNLDLRPTASPRPDLANLPAYVEPPRPAPVPHDGTAHRSVMAILGVTAGTAVLFAMHFGVGSHLRGDPVPQDRIAEAPPPIRLALAAQDVPLPAGLWLVPTGRHANAAPARAHHAARLTRHSSG